MHEIQPKLSFEESRKRCTDQGISFADAATVSTKTAGMVTDAATVSTKTAGMVMPMSRTRVAVWASGTKTGIAIRLTGKPVP